MLVESGYIDLLRVLGERVTVPRAVAEEVQQYGPGDATVQALARLDWLEVIDTGPVAVQVAACGVDPGEAAALTWALAHPGTTVILDDLAGRRCATALHIPVRGTLGLILVAKVRRIIPAARPVVESVRRAGLYLSDRVIEETLAQVGE